MYTPVLFFLCISDKTAKISFHKSKFHVLTYFPKRYDIITLKKCAITVITVIFTFKRLILNDNRM